MIAVTAPEPGGPEALRVAQVPDLAAPGPGEVLLDVVASAVNRADVMQRRGHYPPPPGASDVLGLECSGRIAALGPGVEGWAVGDEVCALLTAGGQAGQVLVPAGQLLPVPAGVDLVTAAALPEVACTVWANVVDLGRLRAGEWFLVHGGSSGIGTHAVQLASALGAHVAVTVGSEAKAERCRELGAEVTVLYREQDFVDEVRRASQGHGVDLILDNMGAKYLARNVDLLATRGRLVVIGLQGGTTGELPLGQLLPKRASVHATSLRLRDADEKAAVVAGVLRDVWPLVADGRVRPIVDSVMPLAQVAEAHRHLEASAHVGKVLLTV